MKKKVYLLWMMMICFSAFSQHHRFSITWSYALANGKTPSLTTLTHADALARPEAEQLLKELIDKSKLDFKCIYNGCQNRAMMLSLLLQKKGVKHYKIWNFEPSMVSLFSKMESLNVDDALGMRTSKIYWGFHVAVSLLIKGPDNRIDTAVVDPSFAGRLLSVSEWLAMQNSPNSSYTFLDPQWYNFVTLPGTSFTCNGGTVNIPGCYPKIITGDFYEFNANSKNLVATEMATNEQITRAATELISKLPINDPNRQKLTATVTSDFLFFKGVLQGTQSLSNDDPFKKYLKDYQAAYTKSVDYWTKQLN